MENIVATNIGDLIVTVIVAVLSSTGLWKFLETKREKIITDTQNEIDRDCHIKELIVCLAKAQICHTATLYIERGYITNVEADMLEHLFQPYHEIGGNGSGEVLYKQAMNLPRRSEVYEEKKEKE